jgi:drug/metabolite transporter (DMT)-like permease
VLWNFGVSRLALPVASLHNNAIPIFSALAATALGIVPSWQQLVGGAIVLSGVAWLQLRQLLALRAAGRGGP